MRRRTIFWTLAVLVCVILITPLATSNLGGLIVLLPVLPAMPSIVLTLVEEMRMRHAHRLALREIEDDPWN